MTESRATVLFAILGVFAFGCERTLPPPPPLWVPTTSASHDTEPQVGPEPAEPTDGLPGADCCEMVSCTAPFVETFDIDVDGDVDDVAIASSEHGSVVVATRRRGGIETAFVPTGEEPDPASRLTRDGDDRVAVTTVGDGFVLSYRDSAGSDDRLFGQHLDAWGGPTAEPTIWADAFTVRSLSLASFVDGALALYSDGERVESLAVETSTEVVRSVSPIDADDAAATVALANTATRATMVWYEPSSFRPQIHAMPLSAMGSPVGAPSRLPISEVADGTLRAVSGAYGTGVVYGVRIAGSRPELRFYRLDTAAAPHGVAHLVSEPGERATDPALAKLGCGYAAAYRASGYERENEVRVVMLDEVGNDSARITIGDADETGPVAVSVDAVGNLLVAWIDGGSHDTSLRLARMRCGS